MSEIDPNNKFDFNARADLSMIHSIDNCQICGHNLAYKLIRKEKIYNEVRLESTWVECTNCASAHIDPYPSPTDLLRYYKTGYVDMCFEGSSDQDASHTLHYAADYLPTVFENYGFSLADAGISREQLQSKTILDYGCATGLFMRYLKEVCLVDPAVIFGMDVESDMLETCRDLALNVFSIDQKDLMPVRADLITLWNVIEHIHDPKSAIESLLDLLAENGEILIETPMFGSLAKKLSDKWSHFIIVEHINLFSRQAIKKMFAEAGMECISESSFGANLPAMADPVFKKALDQMAKEKDFGATQVLRFRRVGKNSGSESISA